jgi:hypothetical protein
MGESWQLEAVIGLLVANYADETTTPVELVSNRRSETAFLFRVTAEAGSTSRL